MEIQRDSNLEEYARHFWERQRAKGDPGDRDALAGIDAGENPVTWLSKPEKYPYKFPHPDSNLIRIAFLDRAEVEALLIHDYMPCDPWMRKRGLVPDPYARNLADLAGISISRDYFDGRGNDTQQVLYRIWKARGSLKDVIAGSARTLIECVRPGEYEIVDGWGRLLPFAALLRQGYEFHPVETFVAWRPFDVPSR